MQRTGNQAYQPSTGWLRRLIDALLNRSAVPQEQTGKPSDSARLSALSLEIAGCDKLENVLPAQLKTLERSFRQYNGLESAHLLIATRCPGEELQLHTPGAHPGRTDDLPPGVTGFVRYQLSGTLGSLDELHSLAMPLPASTEALHAIRLQSTPADAWLMLSGPVSLPKAAAATLESLARSLGQGLAIHAAHRQRLEQAITHERRTHAAELHDSLAQVLGYLRLGTSRLDARCGRCDQPELQAIAADLSQQTRHAYRMLRDLISSSRLTLEGGSLHSALAAVVREFEQRSALVFELDDRCPQREPDESSAIQLLMIVREALSNAVRHAHASHLRIQLLPLDNGGLHLRVEDNGEGLDPERRRGDSFGLGIMQERAARIGARFSIEERPGGGTRIELILEDNDARS
ncbi:ATP-binding protein [Marinobacterium mangrovicola]|uniref:histidine kinase n=1 Tax=Marinobacterium mangrovicola TaxID=1476959 RepID=A0A4R1GFK1_9GAMM|nr:ATP-binding protein [Marinobacterium mangrovicola]TCK07187.1 histidine kinase [Marinobacterium mangrovicola]